jgi:hypothetical protein
MPNIRSSVGASVSSVAHQAIAVEYLRQITPLLGATLVGPELLFAKINTLIAADGKVDASVMGPLSALAHELAE